MAQPLGGAGPSGASPTLHSGSDSVLSFASTVAPRAPDGSPRGSATPVVTRLYRVVGTELPSTSSRHLANAEEQLFGAAPSQPAAPSTSGGHLLDD